MGHRIPKVGPSIATHRATPIPRLPSPNAISATTCRPRNQQPARNVSLRDHFGFGAGRRICPGMNVADRSLLLGVSRIFWAFDAKPKEGVGLPVQDDFVPGFVAVPKRFECEVLPRSEGKRGIVGREWERCKERLGEDGQFIG